MWACVRAPTPKTKTPYSILPYLRTHTLRNAVHVRLHRVLSKSPLSFLIYCKIMVALVTLGLPCFLRLRSCTVDRMSNNNSSSSSTSNSTSGGSVSSSSNADGRLLSPLGGATTPANAGAPPLPGVVDGALGLAATVASFYNEPRGSGGGAGAAGAGMPAILPSPIVPSLGLPVAAAGRRGGAVPLAVAATPAAGGAGPGGGGGGGASGVGASGGSMADALQPPGMELSQALQVCHAAKLYVCMLCIYCYAGIRFLAAGAGGYRRAA